VQEAEAVLTELFDFNPPSTLEDDPRRVDAILAFVDATVGDAELKFAPMTAMHRYRAVLNFSDVALSRSWLFVALFGWWVDGLRAIIPPPSVYGETALGTSVFSLEYALSCERIPEMLDLRTPRSRAPNTAFAKAIFALPGFSRERAASAVVLRLLQVTVHLVSAPQAPKVRLRHSVVNHLPTPHLGQELTRRMVANFVAIARTLVNAGLPAIGAGRYREQEAEDAPVPLDPDLVLDLAVLLKELQRHCVALVRRLSGMVRDNVTLGLMRHLHDLVRAIEEA
jgi:hypothetical protein